MKSRIFYLLAIILSLLLLTPAAISEDASSDLHVQVIIGDPPQMIEKDSYYTLKGQIISPYPITSVQLKIYDEILLEDEYVKTINFNNKVNEYSLEQMITSDNFNKLSPGEKTLIISCQSGENIVEAYRARFSVLGVPKEPVHITDSCTFTMRGNKVLLLEGEYSSRKCWKPQSQQDAILISLSEAASSLKIDWLTPPSGFIIECMDDNGYIKKTYSPEAGYSFYTDLFELGEGIQEVRITLSDLSSGICAVRVYGINPPSVDIPDFLPMPDKIDLLVVSTHEDDELLMFGGAIPHYTATGKDVGVLYMTDCGRHRYQEAMNGLWMSGVTYHPVFFGLADKHTSSPREAFQLWKGKDNTIALLVEAIRKYKPEVVMTHGENGEYGHKQHIATSEAVLLAVQAAGDPKKYPSSYEKYGAWQVKKTYRHEKGDGHIIMDWNVPMDVYDGRTPQQISEISYSRHTSQYYGGVKFTLGSYYDYYGYTLVDSHVGPDAEGGDFFENID